MTRAVAAVLEPGRPEPLGAHWDGSGVNFAIHAGGAERVQLCLFDSAGEEEVARLALPSRSGDVWHGRLPGCPGDQVYGYRIVQGAASDRPVEAQSAKLLLDPYSRRLAGAWRWHEAQLPGSAADNAAFAYKSRVDAGSFSWGGDARLKRPWSETVIYELHVKGFTARHPDVAPGERGRFAGLTAPAVIAYLRDLGVTAVELLPVMAFLDEPALVERGLGNYWGYNPLNFFTPDPRYGGPQDFKAMVKALHAAGIEVILDVVYNHTAEGDAEGPVYSWRGIDPGSYYRFLDAEQSVYANDTGCGNCFDLSSAPARRLVLDSLRYWAEEMHVDGFRFDLAASLLRDAAGFEPGSGFLRELAEDPLLRDVKLIAEPWDLGPGGYRLGQFPTNWSEWNDRFRDGLRDFWLTRGANTSELAQRLSGSSDIFHRDGRGPAASINYVTSHDGFTLNDLVTYQQKQNAANGEGNADGTDDNRNWNCGAEGPSDDPQVAARRGLLRRALLSTLLFSQGVPMLLAGDELGRTQGGNNNAYCQDNAISWLDWTPGDASQHGFIKRLLALRRSLPQLRRGSWAEIARQARWFRPDGEAMTEADWHAPGGSTLGLELAGCHPAEKRLMLLFNAGEGPVTFSLAQGEWLPLLDSALDRGARPGPLPPGGGCVVEGRSLVLLQAQGSQA